MESLEAQYWENDPALAAAVKAVNTMENRAERLDAQAADEGLSVPNGKLLLLRAFKEEARNDTMQKVFVLPAAVATVHDFYQADVLAELFHLKAGFYRLVCVDPPMALLDGVPWDAEAWTAQQVLVGI
jgi:hypothetical protein